MPRERTLESLFEQDLAACEERELPAGRVVYISTRSPIKKDQTNEDALLVLDLGKRGLVLAVADGAGGLPQGAWAARVTLECLIKSFQDGAANADNSNRTLILDAFEAASQQIQAAGTGAATTVAVAEVADGTMRTYHAGDSAVLLFGKKGKLKFQTIAHSPVGYAVEAGLIDEKAAIHHEDRHLVSNFVGMPTMRIEIGPSIEMAPLDRLLIASDGVVDNLLIEEIVERVRLGKLADAGEKLRSICQHRMTNENSKQPSKPDDMSFVLFELGSEV